MKFCPYCGASLADSAASFCAECGKALPAIVPGSGKSGRSAQPVKVRPFVGKPRPITKKTVKRPPQSPAQRPPPPDPRDDGYDGYYDDVKPVDNGHTRDRLDPELVKRAVTVAAGALIIIILSVVLMYVL
jgi:hypothetical protein